MCWWCEAGLSLIINNYNSPPLLSLGSSSTGLYTKWVIIDSNLKSSLAKQITLNWNVSPFYFDLYSCDRSAVESFMIFSQLILDWDQRKMMDPTIRELRSKLRGECWGWAPPQTIRKWRLDTRNGEMSLKWNCCSKLGICLFLTLRKWRRQSEIMTNRFKNIS